MSVRWNKLGLLYCPAGSDRHPQLLSHAANPLPVLIEGDLYRVFYSARDADNRSSVAAVDIDMARREVVREHADPFFSHGSEGSFFADGASIGCCYEAGGLLYMLFMGWQNPADAHWRGDIGRLVVTPDLTLELDSETPFMGSDTEDPLSLSYPCVKRDAAGGYRMWYGSTLSWDAGNGEMLHVIKQASSADGHEWIREGLAVPYRLGEAQAFSRPTVLADRDANGLSMWFSCRGGSDDRYRIGYARSDDGRRWQLDNARAGIGLSSTGWDSEMIEYPYVFEHDGRAYLLYNGNGYGKSGFGLAVMAHG